MGNSSDPINSSLRAGKCPKWKFVVHFWVIGKQKFCATVAPETPLKPGECRA
jgi:hypothetical protein